MKKVISLLLIIVCITTAFAGCGKEPTIIGTWSLTTSNSDEFVVGDSITFNEDGTVVYSSAYYGSEIEGTYELIDANNMELDIGGLRGSCTYVLERGSLSGAFGSIELVFKQ